MSTTSRIQQSRNALLPNLSLTGNYTSRPRRYLCPTATCSTMASHRGADRSRRSGRRPEPDVRLRFLGLPVRPAPDPADQVARGSADMADAMVRKKQDTLTVRTTQQTIRLNMLNAITNLESQQGIGEARQDGAGFRREEPGRREQEVRTGHRTSAGRDSTRRIARCRRNRTWSSTRSDCART